MHQWNLYMDIPFLHDGKCKFLLLELIAISKDYNLLSYNKFVGAIVLDCKGIDDPKPWATKPFILCLAISSTFILTLITLMELLQEMISACYA